MKINTFTAEQIAALIAEFGTDQIRSSQLWNYDKKLFRIAQLGGAEKLGRGLWKLPPAGSAGSAVKPVPLKASKPAKAIANEEPTEAVAHSVARIAPVAEIKSKVINAAQRFANGNIPQADPRYVSFGEFPLIKKIVSSKKFFPVFITGESGNGKTFMVQQACAAAKRELFRVNFTPRTDEGELIGEVGLINGETFFEEGVVIAAMRRGGVLLLDEIDYASPEGFTAIQSIMEGAPYLVKKTGEIVAPAAGFTVVATANTKGQGDDSGKYYGAQLLNEAFLERFPIVVEQEYPNEATESKILSTFAELEGIDIKAADVTRLVSWASGIRKAYANKSVESTMTTRRLVHVIRAFGIIGNLRKSVEACVARFDKSTTKAFVQFYSALEAPAAAQPSTNEALEAAVQEVNSNAVA